MSKVIRILREEEIERREFELNNPTKLRVLNATVIQWKLVNLSTVCDQDYIKDISYHMAMRVLVWLARPSHLIAGALRAGRGG